MIKNRFAMFAAATLLGAASAQAGVVLNGTNFNGVALNGVGLNGANPNGAPTKTLRGPLGVPLRSLAKKPLAGKATAQE